MRAPERGDDRVPAVSERWQASREEVLAAIRYLEAGWPNYRWRVDKGLCSLSHPRVVLGRMKVTDIKNEAPSPVPCHLFISRRVW